jgi:poly(A) polymerase
VRIAARFELSVDPATLAAARDTAPQITVVSAERIAEELRKLLTHPNRVRGVRLLREFGLVEHVLPELTNDTVWQRGVRVVEELHSPTWPHPEAVSFPLAFSVLLHEVGAPTAERVADRLRLSNAEKVRVVWLVEMHQSLTDAPSMRPCRLYPILVHPGIGDLLSLHRALAVGGGRGVGHVEFCERVIRDTPPEVLNPPPVLTGNDLIAIGLKPGRDFKRLLDAVRDAQLDGQIRSRDEALAMIRDLIP